MGRFPVAADAETAMLNIIAAASATFVLLNFLLANIALTFLVDGDGAPPRSLDRVLANEDRSGVGKNLRPLRSSLCVARAAP
jgi:hypothetical protein